MNQIKHAYEFAKAQKNAFMEKHKGSVAQVIGGLVVGVVMLFVGLFMIDTVSSATAINSSSDFYSTYTGLITTTGTIFTVLGLVIIIVALATAISSLRNVSQ